MQNLIEYARTLPDRIADHRTMFAALADGQNPETLFISCSDSRVIPALITGAQPGEVFELRTAGNVIARYRPQTPCAVAATIEYAVTVLDVTDIIVCGHTYCGAVQAMAGRVPLQALPEAARWLNCADFADTDRPEPDGRPAPEMAAESRRHLVNQIEHLHTYPFVAERVVSGRLRVHGWLYAVDTGRVTVRVPGGDAFDTL